ncbi:MAG: aminoacyl-tRNA hydrolase [Candidatus Eisenbacteria bacterium]|nr:aminoacyl-tRNA hydrolase [Candidatus Eisenbacteria bacterium]
MIRVGHGIALDEREIVLRFVRSSGPGGQNVNKVATAVELRFDAARSPSLPDDVRARLLRLAGRRATRAGVVVIDARRHRTQEGNRRDAVERLVELVARAAVRPKRRRPTKPTGASRERRIRAKRARSETKRARGRAVAGED